MSNGGLMIGNAIQSGLSTYGQLQNIDANKQAMGLREADAKMRAESHKADMRESNQREQFNNARMRQLQDDEMNRANQLVARKMRALSGAGVEWTPENQKALSEFGRLADPEYLLSPETGSAIEAAESVLRGETDMNDPAAIQAYNRLLNVQRGATGGRQVSINRLVPSKSGQGVYVGLNVRNQDGTEYANGALSDRRSSDPDDPVTELTFDELVNVLGTAKQMRGALSNPKMAQAFIDYYDPQPRVSAKDQSSIEFNRSRSAYYNVKTENERKNIGGKYGSGNPPAKAQMIEFYRGMGYSDEDAISMANDSASSPEKFVTSYSRMLLETSKDEMGKPTMTPDQAFDAALGVYNENFRKKPSPKSKGGQQTESSTAKQPLDVVNEMAGTKKPEVKIPMRAPTQAPTSALEALKNHPEKRDEFKAKYGYLPDGF